MLSFVFVVFWMVFFCKCIHLTRMFQMTDNSPSSHFSLYALPLFFSLGFCLLVSWCDFGLLLCFVLLFLLGAAWIRSRAERRADASTFRMQINQQIDVQDELNKAKQNKLQITNYKLKRSAGRTRRREPTSTYTAEVFWGVYPKRGGEAECKSRRSRGVIECILVTR